VVVAALRVLEDKHFSLKHLADSMDWAVKLTFREVLGEMEGLEEMPLIQHHLHRPLAAAEAEAAQVDKVVGL
jgi:hypothetical protein